MHKSKVVYAPMKSAREDSTKVDIFMAGSIEMGRAHDWQTMLGYVLSREEAVGRIFNPRRMDWDSNWKQSADNPEYSQQVNWELNHIEKADIIFFNFVPGTMSPITLAELGYVLGLSKLMVVCCPDEFWRKGNVDIMCQRSGFKAFNNYEESVEKLIDAVNYIHGQKKEFHGL